MIFWMILKLKQNIGMGVSIAVINTAIKVILNKVIEYKNRNGKWSNGKWN